MKRRINTRQLIIHCSATDNPAQDSIEAIRNLHTAKDYQRFTWGAYKTYGKGFSDIGYHYFIDKAGVVHEGRHPELQGAHCKGHNEDSVGICVSGRKKFTEIQLRKTAFLVQDLMGAYDLVRSNVRPHSSFDRRKSCPNFDLEILWRILDEKRS